MAERCRRCRSAYFRGHTWGNSRGIEIARDQDAENAAEIEAWLELLTRSYNVIVMDSVAFRLWAKLMHKSSDALYEEAMLAATARVHRLTVVTKNVADFKSFGVETLDPFKTPSRQAWRAFSSGANPSPPWQYRTCPTSGSDRASLREHNLNLNR